MAQNYPNVHSHGPLQAAKQLGLALVITAGAIGQSAVPAHAANAVVGTGTPASCTEAAFDAALATVQAASGGTVTFDCGGAATIVITAQKTISANGALTIDGAKTITLTGNNATRPFLVDAPANLILKDLTVQQGTAAGGPGAVLVRSGAQLNIQNSNFNSNYSTAASGGAIGGDAGSTISVDGGVFSGNGAFERGGAISSAGYVYISRSTFAFNGAHDGGAVALTSIINLIMF